MTFSCRKFLPGSPCRSSTQGAPGRPFFMSLSARAKRAPSIPCRTECKAVAFHFRRLARRLARIHRALRSTEVAHFHRGIRLRRGHHLDRRLHRLRFCPFRLMGSVTLQARPYKDCCGAERHCDCARYPAGPHARNDSCILGHGSVSILRDCSARRLAAPRSGPSTFAEIERANRYQ